MKMFEIVEFPKLYEGIKDKKMPFKTAHKFSKLFRKVEEEIRFYQESFQKITEEYGEKDAEGNFIPQEDGKGIKMKEGSFTEANKKIIELNTLEIEIAGIDFSIDELESLDLTIGEINFLMPFITGEE